MSGRHRATHVEPKAPTAYVVVWRVMTEIGPRREMTRCLTWERAAEFITQAETAGVEIREVVFL